jgi:hypothetical protein
MIKVECEGHWQIVVEATARASQLLGDPAFYARIREHPRFDYTDVSPRDIAQLMEQAAITLRVQTYKSFNPLSRVLGYEDARYPNDVFLNTRRFDRSMASIVGTILHEAVHAVDALSPLDFGHGGNSAAGKDNSAPYWIGNLAISMVSGEPLAAIEHAPQEVPELAA